MTVFSILPLLTFFIIYLLLKIKGQGAKIYFLKRIFFGLILGLSLSSFYLIPTIYYSGHTQSQKEGFATLYERSFVNLKQLLYSKWGYGPITSNAKDGEISFQVGIAQWLSVILILILLILRRFNKNNILLTISLLFAYFFAIFMMLDLSKPIWNFINNFTTIDTHG